MPIPPIALNVLLCDSVHRDRDSGKYSFLGAFHSLSFARFPARIDLIWAYLSFTEVNGEYNLRVQIVDINEEREPIRQIQGQLKANNPLEIIQLAVPFVNLEFTEGGKYSFQVLVDDELIAERRITITQKEGEPDDT